MIEQYDLLVVISGEQRNCLPAKARASYMIRPLSRLLLISLLRFRLLRSGQSMDDVIFYFSLDTAYSSPRKRKWFDTVFSCPDSASSVCTSILLWSTTLLLRWFRCLKGNRASIILCRYVTPLKPRP